MSSSYNQSSSSNSTIPVQTPQNAIMDQIAQTAQNMAQSLYSWAGQTFAQTSAITNQAVGNFFNVSNKMLGLSNNMTDQYNSLFAPENAQLVADANSYASPARMATDMGMAGATQAQAGKAALDNSEEALRSYGIDPSAGRYAALDKAAAVQNAANVAGAENTQRVSDIATGQKLRSEAVQVGAQLPAAISNVNNTAIQANTGASNAELANANTGANMYGLADKYLGTGMQLKMPFSQSQGSSQSSGSSNSPSKPSNDGSGSGSHSGSGNGSGGYQGGNGNMMPNNTAAMGNGGGGGVFGQGGSKIMQVGGSDAAGGPAQGDNGAVVEQPGDWGINPGDTFGGPNSDPTQGPTYGSGTDQGAGAFGNSNGTDWGNGNTFGGDSSMGMTGDTFNPGGDSGGGGADQTGLGAYDYQQPTDQSAIPTDWTDPSQPASDPGVWGDQSSGAVDTSGGGDMSGGMDYSDFARGGAVMMRHLSNRHYAPMMAEGGQVPTSASPSGGARVDDVQAGGPGLPKIHLNANEFVIPQDVALWKGQEFFQKLINQSRMARHGAPAKPTVSR